MSSIINVNALSLVIVSISFILLLGPTSMTMNVLATTNTANQGIGQSQSAIQLGVCVSGNGTLFSCNNVNKQNQANSGSNAVGQQGGSGKGGNTANQGIGQSQSSNQNAQCVAGGSLSNSCSNKNTQSQTNTGNNAAAQSGGSGSGGNTANQGIGQSQTSNQNAQCVSGKDAIVSCDNENFQNQVNSGSNVLGQK